MTHQLQGLCGVLATPFDNSGLLDHASLQRQVRFYLDRGATSLMALGVMGEGPSLSAEEGLEVVHTVAMAAGSDVPLTVGAVGMKLDAAITFGKQVVDAGASSLMMTAPDDVPPASLADHFGQLTSATGAKLVLLDCPGIAPTLSVDCLVDLAQQLEAFCAIKLEDNPTHLKIDAIKSRVGDRLALFGANGAVMCLSELDRGCDGFMTGYAFPEHLIEIMTAHAKGNRQEAAEAYTRYLPLITYCWQAKIGLALRKELLVKRGAIDTAYVRAPNESVDSKTRTELLGVMDLVASYAGRSA